MTPAEAGMTPVRPRGGGSTGAFIEVAGKGRTGKSAVTSADKFPTPHTKKGYLPKLLNGHWED
jgi:hypothetical protein